MKRSVGADRRGGAESELLTSLTPARRQLAFYLLLLGAFMPSLNMFVVTIALPVIRDALGATPAESSLIISGYSSAYAVCLITGGRLGDLFGRRLMFLIGMSGFTAMSLMCGLAPNTTVLVAGRVLQGVFSAVMAPPVLAGIRTLFRPQDIPWALNIYGTGIGIAVAAGQFLGGMLISVNAWGLGWRSAFLVNVPVGILALIAVPFLVPESESHEKPRLDYGGVLLLSAALASFVLPLSMGREQHWAPWVLALLAASPLLVIAFLGFERALTRRGGMPVLDAKLLEIRSFRSGLVVALLFFFTAPFYSVLLALSAGRAGRVAACGWPRRAALRRRQFHRADAGDALLGGVAALSLRHRHGGRAAGIWPASRCARRGRSAAGRSSPLSSSAASARASPCRK